MMVGVGGPDEPVEGDVQFLLQALVHVGVAARQLGGGQPFGRGGLGHLEAVLVGAGQVTHVEAVEPLEPRDDVGGDVLVRVPQVRSGVGVGDRVGDVIGLHWDSTLLCGG